MTTSETANRIMSIVTRSFLRSQNYISARTLHTFRTEAEACDAENIKNALINDDCNEIDQLIALELGRPRG